MKLLCIMILIMVFTPLQAFGFENSLGLTEYELNEQRRDILDGIPEEIYHESQHIDWQFNTYAEPNFMSEITGTFLPQTVSIIEKTDTGWGLITTVNGNCWIYLSNIEQHYIDWPFITYEEPNLRSDIVGTFSPQTVTVIDNIGGWGLISTHKGDYWTYIREDMSSARQDLDTFIKSYGSGVSVYYENIANGYTYTYNAGKQYYSASIIKAPYGLYLYDLADKGLIDLNKTHTYTSEKWRGGSGEINKMAFGTNLSEAELLGYNIKASDNVAFRMLLGKYGPSNFKRFISELGGRVNTLNNLTNAFVNLADVALYARLIYDYIETPGINNERLKQDLLDSTTSFIRLNHPTASKYGLWDKAMHDMSIVYSDSPYILVIMSDKGVAGDGVTPRLEAYNIFKDIAAKVREFNSLFEP